MRLSWDEPRKLYAPGCRCKNGQAHCVRCKNAHQCAVCTSPHTVGSGGFCIDPPPTGPKATPSTTKSPAPTKPTPAPVKPTPSSPYPHRSPRAPRVLAPTPGPRPSLKDPPPHPLPRPLRRWPCPGLGLPRRPQPPLPPPRSRRRRHRPRLRRHRPRRRHQVSLASHIAHRSRRSCIRTEARPPGLCDPNPQAD